jgi:hypothetical protein
VVGQRLDQLVARCTLLARMPALTKSGAGMTSTLRPTDNSSPEHIYDAPA